MELLIPRHCDESDLLFPEHMYDCCVVGIGRLGLCFALSLERIGLFFLLQIDEHFKNSMHCFNLTTRMRFARRLVSTSRRPSKLVE